MKILISSILAGIMIAIGSIVYLQVGGAIGAFTFAIGLMTITLFDLHLYTGKVSYLTKNNELLYIGTVLLGNIIGCCTMFAFPVAAAVPIVEAKVAAHWSVTLVEAMLCNMLIYIGVEGKKKGSLATLILAVGAFILAGFEHSIASICFIISARYFTWDTLLYLIITILGNAFGGILLFRARRYMSE